MSPSTPTAWEGPLEPLGESFRSSETVPIRISIGQPSHWPAAEAVAAKLGQSWQPPAGGQLFTLLSLPFTLHPTGDRWTHYREVRLHTYLRPRRSGAAVIAHDLFPRRVTADSKRTTRFGLGPDLKFGEKFEVSLLEFGLESETTLAFPVIQAFGEGESAPYWQFSDHGSQPLVGSQRVYLVAAAPPAAAGLRLAVELIATVETRFGPLRLTTPSTAKEALTFSVAG